MSRKLMLLIIIVVLSTSVVALGIRPAQTKAQFVPDAKGTYTFRIVNDEKRDQVITLEARGSLSDLISLPEKTVTIKANEDVRDATFVLLFPSSMAPGSYTGEVLVSLNAFGTVTSAGVRVEDAPSIAESSGITSRLQLIHKITLDVLPDGKFIVANVRLQEEQDKVDVLTDIQNKGLEKIDVLSSQVSIVADSGVLEMLPANTGSLDIFENVRFKDTLEKLSFGEGSYTVKAEIVYDNARLELSKKFQIGDPRLAVKGSEQYIAQGMINKWNLELLSLWNEELTGQELELVLKKNGAEVNKWKTLTFSVEPRTTKAIRSYIDATKLDVGNYEVEVRSLTGIPLLNGTRQLQVVPEDQMPKSELRGDNLIMMVIVFMGVIIMLLIIMVMLLFFQRRKPT